MWKQSVAVLLSALLAGQTLAAPKEAVVSSSLEAERLARAADIFDAARASYNLRDYQTALKGFEESYLLSREPVLLLNVAQCYRYMGRYADAGDAFRAYLREDPASELRPETERLISQMDALARQAADAAATLAAAGVERASPAPSFQLTSAPAQDGPPPSYIPAKLLYGVTAGSFVLGLGAGGLAVAMSAKANRLQDQAENEPPGAFDEGLIAAAEDASRNAGLVAASLAGTAVIATGAAFLLKRRHDRKARERAATERARLIPLLEEPAPLAE